MPAPLVRVIAPFYAPDRVTPATGKIALTLTAAIHVAGERVYEPITITAILDQAGNLVLDESDDPVLVVASDPPGSQWAAPGVPYRITTRLNETRSRSFEVFIPADSPVVDGVPTADLTTLLPAASPLLVDYAPRSAVNEEVNRAQQAEADVADQAAAELVGHETAHPAHSAAGVALTPGAGVAAVDVQAAIAELAGMIVNQEAGDSAAVAAVAAGLLSKAGVAGGNAFTGAQSVDGDWLWASPSTVLDPRHPRYGAIADGGTHPLSERYGTLAAAQAFYGPWVSALTQTIDWAAIQKAIKEAESHFFTDSGGMKHCSAMVRLSQPPAGGYYVTKDPLDIFVGGLALEAANTGVRIHNITADSDVIRINNLSNKLIEKPRVARIMLDGTGTGGRAIYANLVSHLLVEDVDARRHPGTGLWTEAITDLDLLDANGTPTLNISAVAGYVVAVQVAAGTNPNTFKLFTRVEGALVSTDDNLVMDPTSADYAPDRIAASVTANPYIVATDLFSDSAIPANNPAVKASTALPPASFLGCGFTLAIRLHCQPGTAVPCIVDKAGLSPTYIACRTRQGSNGYYFENTRSWTLIAPYVEDNSKGPAGTRAGVKCRNVDLYGRKRGGKIIGAYVENNSEYFVDADKGSYVEVENCGVAGGSAQTMQLFDRAAGAGKKTLEMAALADGLTVEVQNGTTANTFKLLIYQAAALVETWDNLASPAAAEVALAASVYVRARNLKVSTAAPNNNPKVAGQQEIPRFFWDAIRLDGGGTVRAVRSGGCRLLSAAGRIRVENSSVIFGRVAELDIAGLRPPFDGAQLNQATNSWFDTDPAGVNAWGVSGTGPPTLGFDAAVGFFGRNSKKVIFQPGGPPPGATGNSAYSRVNMNSTQLRDGAGAVIAPAAGDIYSTILVAKFDQAGRRVLLRHDAGGTGSSGFAIESDTDWLVCIIDTLAGSTGGSMRLWAHSYDSLIAPLTMWVGALAAGQNAGGRLALINTELPAPVVGESRFPKLRVADDSVFHKDLYVTGALHAGSLAGTFSPTPLGRGKTAAGTPLLTKPGAELSTVTTQALTAGTVRYEPMFVESAVTLDRLYLEVTGAAVATSKARLAILTATADWQPGNLVLDAGEVAVDALAVLFLTINQVLAQGRYLIAINSNGAPTLRGYRGGQKYLGMQPGLGSSPFAATWTAALAYGAYVDPLPAASSASAATPFIHTTLVRVSAP